VLEGLPQHAALPVLPELYVRPSPPAPCAGSRGRTPATQRLRERSAPADFRRRLLGEQHRLPPPAPERAHRHSGSSAREGFAGAGLLLILRYPTATPVADRDADASRAQTGRSPRDRAVPMRRSASTTS
jgi:hypothetical protein